MKGNLPNNELPSDKKYTFLLNDKMSKYLKKTGRRNDVKIINCEKT